MLNCDVEELLEGLYVYEVEGDSYPAEQLISQAAQEALLQWVEEREE